MIKRNLYKTKLKDIRSIIDGVFVLSFVRNFEFKAVLLPKPCPKEWTR